MEVLILHNHPIARYMLKENFKKIYEYLYDFKYQTYFKLMHKMKNKVVVRNFDWNKRDLIYENDYGQYPIAMPVVRVLRDYKEYVLKVNQCESEYRNPIISWNEKRGSEYFDMCTQNIKAIEEDYFVNKNMDKLFKYMPQSLKLKLTPRQVEDHLYLMYQIKNNDYKTILWWGMTEKRKKTRSGCMLCYNNNWAAQRLKHDKPYYKASQFKIELWIIGLERIMEMETQCGVCDQTYIDGDPVNAHSAGFGCEECNPYHNSDSDSDSDDF